VGARALETGLWGASRNVHINLPDVQDDAFRRQVSTESDGLVARAAQKAAEVLAILEQRK
jgi:glutamate formiminotransferase/formiminotetrahydrofolate cyclodeaminase